MSLKVCCHSRLLDEGKNIWILYFSLCRTTKAHSLMRPWWDPDGGTAGCHPAARTFSGFKLHPPAACGRSLFGILKLDSLWDDDDDDDFMSWWDSDETAGHAGGTTGCWTLTKPLFALLWKPSSLPENHNQYFLLFQFCTVNPKPSLILDKKTLYLIVGGL